SKIVLENRCGPPAELARIVGPNASTPISKATGLRQEQIVKGIAVAMLGCGNSLGFLGEQGADLFHGSQYMAVAFYPREIVRPASSLHVKASIFLPQILDELLQGVRASSGSEPVPNPFLQNRLDCGKIPLVDSQRGQ